MLITWALGYLSQVGSADALPNVVRVKFIQLFRLFFALFHFAF